MNRLELLAGIMTTTPLERRVFRSYWDDGLLDVFAAIGVTAIGLLWLRDIPAGAVIVPPLLIPLWAQVRRKWIEPRAGFVEFSDDREYRSKRLLRLVFYLGAGLAGAAFGWQPGAILAAAGATMLVISLTILVRFLRANPAGREVGA